MRRPMVTRDVETFVALGRAVSLAAAEGALEPEEARDLAAALVAGILSGCMEFDTYARIHDALARLLDRAFEAEAAPLQPPPGPTEEEPPDEPLGVYLEVVGEAWDQVGGEENCAGLKGFAARVFDLGRARFGNGGWFSAPLRVSGAELIRLARGAGLLIVSLQGPEPAAGAEVRLGAPGGPPPKGFRLLLGWGDRRAALETA
ncbi:hypothetical protein [Deferrisoma palaeochoriense]